ncbi:DUF2397 family protein [Streptomyces abikoensis]|uniref:DUF2397 family protein n=1 Tax=Streptomyces abikoensis TaxID=97398 RepID=A0ABW7SXN0_9ACTN
MPRVIGKNDRAMTSTPKSPAPPLYPPFAHLTAPGSALYRRTMQTFLTAKERFAVHLRPEDVHAALPAGERPAELDAVVNALDSLVKWGNLRADPDTARVTAVEDFYRKRFVYQLTQAGEAAEEALSAYDEALGRRKAWASAGLLRDKLSSTVLTLNLRGTPALDWMAETGEPCALHLRQLTHQRP